MEREGDERERERDRDRDRDSDREGTGTGAPGYLTCIDLHSLHQPFIVFTRLLKDNVVNQSGIT